MFSSPPCQNSESWISGVLPKQAAHVRPDPVWRCCGAVGEMQLGRDHPTAESFMTGQVSRPSKSNLRYLRQWELCSSCVRDCFQDSLIQAFTLQPPCETRTQSSDRQCHGPPPIDLEFPVSESRASTLCFSNGINFPRFHFEVAHGMHPELKISQTKTLSGNEETEEV